MNGGHCSLVVLMGAGSGPLRLHPSYPPASQISACAASRLCQPKRSASRSAAKAQKAPAHRVLEGAAFRGVLLFVPHSTSWPPSPLFPDGAGRVSTEAHTHQSLLLYFWHPLRCEAGQAYRAGRTCRTHRERSIRIEAAQPVAALVPSQSRPGRLRGAGYPAQLAYFTS